MNIALILPNQQIEQLTSLLQSTQSLTIEYSSNSLTDFINHYSTVPCVINKVIISEEVMENPADELRNLRDLVFDTNSAVSINDMYLLFAKQSTNIAFGSYYFSEHKNVKIYSEEVYNVRTINRILGGDNLLTQEVHNVEYDEIVQERIGESDVTQFTSGGFKNTKSAIIVDHPEKVHDYLEKLSIQQKIVDVDGDAVISKDVLKPRNVEMEVEIRHNDTYIQTDEETRNTRKIIAVTGEKGTGKSLLALNLSLSYAHLHKTLLIDASLQNMGLSLLCEQTKPANATVVYIDELITSSDDKTRSLVDKLTMIDKPLTILTLSTKLLVTLNNESVLGGILEIIIFLLRDSYSRIIIDVPLSKYQQYSYIYSNCDNTILTYYHSKSSAYALAKYVRDINLHLKWNQLLFVPTDVYKDLENVKQSKASETKDIIETLIQNPVVITSIVSFSHVGINKDLSLAFDTLFNQLKFLKPTHEPEMTSLTKKPEFDNDSTLENLSELLKDTENSTMELTSNMQKLDTLVDVLDLPNIDIDFDI